MEEVFTYLCPETILDVVSSILKNSGANISLKLQSLYILVNIAASKKDMRDRITMSEYIIQDTLSNLKSQETELVLASLWLLINISWDFEENSERKNKLLGYRIVEKLKDLSNCEISEIRDRVKTLLKNLS